MFTSPYRLQMHCGDTGCETLACVAFLSGGLAWVRVQFVNRTAPWLSQWPHRMSWLRPGSRQLLVFLMRSASSPQNDWPCCWCICTQNACAGAHKVAWKLCYSARPLRAHIRNTEAHAAPLHLNPSSGPCQARASIRENKQTHKKPQMVNRGRMPTAHILGSLHSHYSAEQLLVTV